MPQQHLFVDTNVFLDFYTLSAEDIEELRKLATLVQQGSVALYVTQQIRHEFLRNRDKKIRDTLFQINEGFQALNAPSFLADYPAHQNLQEAINHYEYYYTKLVDQFTHDAKTHNLLADQLIAELFQVSHFIPFSQETYNTAAQRVYLGDPPGKHFSFGDAINWLSLLERVPDQQDLYFIGGDKDFSSAIDRHDFHQFLLSEWQQQKGGTVHYYFQGLGRFFRDNHPHVVYATDFLRARLVDELQQSGSFARTRRILHELKAYEDFTAAEIETLAKAIIFNNQILWIREETAVKETLSLIIQKHANLLDEDTLTRIRLYYPLE